MKLTNEQRASLALEHRLYVPGWSLNPILKDIANGYRGNKVYLEWRDGAPVGVAVSAFNGETWFFVKRTYRRQGIGTKLAKKSRARKGSDNGSKGCVQFFESCEIAV